MPAVVPAQQREPGKLKCLLPVRVGDVKGTATRQTADPSLAHLNEMVGQCKADCGSFLHTGIQREYSPREVCTHRYVYIDSVTPIESMMLICKDEEALCDTLLHGSYRSVLGAVAWTVLT